MNDPLLNQPVAQASAEDLAARTQQFRSQVGHISRQSGIFFAGTIFTIAFGYVFKVYLARVLGAEALGVYALGVTLIGFIGIFNTLGLPQSAVRFVAAYQAAGKFKELHALLWRGAGLLLAAFVFLPPESLVHRFADFVSADGLTGDGRTQLWAETIPLIKSYPVFGCGLGGYETAFSQFKISGVLVTDDFAHNDYLQLLAELGLAGFVIGAALALSVVRSALRAAVNPLDKEARYFAVACVGALTAISLHSLADFNLYIPANAMLLAWIAGMGVAIQSREPNPNVQARFEIPVMSIEEAMEVGSR